MLVRNHVVLVLWVQRLVLRRDVDGFGGQVAAWFVGGRGVEGGGGGQGGVCGIWGGGERACEVFEEVGVVGAVEVEVGVRGVAGL